MSLLEENNIRQQLSKIEKVPLHIGIIPDGNRRFARKKGLSLLKAYEIGAEKVREVLSWCREFGIKYVSIYTLSYENLKNRSEQELKIIFNLLEKKLKRVAKDEEIHKNKVRVLISGDKTILPKNVIEAINLAENSTKNYNNYYLILLVGYGGRKEIIDAIKKIIKDDLKIEEITEKTFRKYLYLPNIPDPDLVIRTSGEQRISNFLLWQIAYSELYFINKYWPELTKQDFIQALISYSKRQRRFGK